MRENSGVVNYGGTTQISQSAIGRGARVTLSADREKGAEQARRADVGVITVKGNEAAAVQEVLGLHEAPAGWLRFWEGEAEIRGSAVRVAAIQALEQGQRSAIVAFDHLRRHYNPAVVVLTGIAGGIDPNLSIGDVVVATRVVYYDLRKETPDGRRRRGEEKNAPAAIGHAVNSYFTFHGEPAHFMSADKDGTNHDYLVHTGPIGSGDAVIADAASEITRYLKAFNDKILAVDMEAGGLMQAFFEQHGPDVVDGWAVVRGISDDASQRKDDTKQGLAAYHAALVLQSLLPYLVVQGT
ncbi:5'-methylthioadenosine/S-adenosylhomocysteine nucleosidase [Microbispora sp. NBC_01189]|uniref:5'-methylthioadenosine/S-adenosylhomocysteine nucleosidase family protein n=1 Tax=Microbispora sp. NBC_01189 TaxID=2903583 RepID=UPI002E12D15C|nr:5'-methylthioadenosine/S-adenosylhomocysteine nucleosidase [Microbispora sp. NBC_01189]